MLDRLKARPGARHRRRRVGRGPGSGIGKTCGTGVKGQGTRSGSGVGRAFEGGQMPLVQRLPKRGFTNIFRKATEIVNVGALAAFGDGSSIDPQALVDRGLVRAAGIPVKLLAEGDAPKGVTVKVCAPTSRSSGEQPFCLKRTGGPLSWVV